jgi:putative membrane protein
MKKLMLQAISGIMATLLFLSGAAFTPSPAYSAEPAVTVDEAAYVNLDYYGGITAVNIVKGCSLNGLTQFKDYGQYLSVNNMSGYDTPIIEADGVQWELKKADPRQRFYYECKVKNDALELPWHIDVSYKLNGVPCKAETLAGASGVVEINVNVKPNPKAGVYFQNNMMLQVTTYVNMEDVYSLDAPGSQLQSAGTYKGVAFAALPGEEDTFTIRIGTDSFETQGIIITMLPGTLKQLKNLKELKEAKDTLYDSFSALHTSMNDVLNTMENMKQGLKELQDGTSSLEDARSSFSSGKEQMNAYADTVLTSLTTGNQQLKNLIPHFETSQAMIRELRADLDDISDTLNDLKNPLDDSTTSISALQGDLAALNSMLAIKQPDRNSALHGSSSLYAF